MIVAEDNPFSQFNGYYLRHVVSHFSDAALANPSCVGQLYRLLALESGRGGNAWHEAKTAVGNIEDYLADIETAWRLAETRREFGMQCRFALVSASANSLDRFLSAPLLVALIERQLWTPSRAIAEIRQMLSMRHEVGDRTDEQAALALTGLAQHLPGELMTDAIAIAQSIEDSHHRMKALMALAQCLPDGLFEESFEALIAQAANADGFDALAELGGRMSPPQLEQLLDAIQGVGVVEKRAAIVLRLRGSLSPQAWSSTLGQLLEAARGLACPETRANVLTNLISHVPGEQRNHVLHEAIEAALAIADAESRAKALTRLLFDLSGELQQQIAERAAEALHAIQNNSLQQSQLRAA